MNPAGKGVLSRRQFATQAALAVAGLGCFLPESLGANKKKPNSKVAGVQIGLNVPYSFGDMQMSGEEILRNCVQLGFSGVELRTQPVEVFLGAPKGAIHPPKNLPPDNAESNSRALAEWRKGFGMNGARAFRKMYQDAGVRIEILKVDGIFKMSDSELDYVFRLAKALGARALSTEISKKEEELTRVGHFADKHRLMIGYHGHASTIPADWEQAFSLAKYNGANVDLGHFVAGNNGSPVEFIKQHHARITHVHVKDRKVNNGPNTLFGEGDTPIREALQTIRDNKWKIQATIEFEYKVPAGSDRMKEIARTLDYCREALASA